MRRRAKVSFLLVSIVLFLLAFCACTPDIQLADPAVVSLSVDGAVTSGYVAGDDLDISDAVLYVTYDNDDIKSIPLEMDMVVSSSFDMTVPGKQTVVVSYGGCTTSFNIEVQPWDLADIKLISTPYVTEYVVGESVNPKGAVIRMSFQQSHNSKEARHTDIEVIDRYLEDYDRYTIGRKTIYVTYANARLSFEVNYIEKTATNINIVKKPDDNYVFIGLGQYRFYLETEDGERTNRYGSVVETSQTYYYETYDEVTAAKASLEKTNKVPYVIGYANRFDFTGMSLRIGFDNAQTPEYDAMTGASLETDTNDDGTPIYKDIEDLASCLTVSINDSAENTVEAILLYLPKDYPSQFVYEFYGAPQVAVGDRVEPGRQLCSNAIDRDGERISLDYVTSKSYGKVESIDIDAYGHGVMVVSTYIEYVLTSVSVNEGDIISDRTPLGFFGTSLVNSTGGGIVTEVKSGRVVVRTAPTTVFTSKVQAKAFKSISLINTDKIVPLQYPETGLYAMIQGDTIDFASGVTEITEPDGSITERGPVRIEYTDGSVEYFRLNSSVISVVNADVEAVSAGLDISKAGHYVLWVVYGGEISYHAELSVTINSRYPVAINILSSSNTISNRRFWFGEYISIANMQYNITYDNGTVSDNRQLTEDMLAEGYSLYCDSAENAYMKYVCFKVKEEDLASVPDGANKNILSEVFRCKVLPPAISDATLEVQEEAKKIFVTGDDKIDLTGAVYSIKYVQNVSKSLEGKEITAADGAALSTGGSALIETEIRNEIKDVYLDEDYNVIVDDGVNVIDLTRMTKIGVRKIAKLVYKDKYYNDFQDDTSFDYYSSTDIYSASTEFYYYVITSDNFSVTEIKVNLISEGGKKIYKDEYSQYEYWDMSGITVTLTVVDASGTTTTATIPATSNMIYDSTTTRLADDIPVKFTFLGAVDDDTLHISVKKRKEKSIDLVRSGKDTYLSAANMDFSGYTFYLRYNAGPYDVINNLTGVGTYIRKDENGDKIECWWYELYQKKYVLLDEDGRIMHVSFAYDEYDRPISYTSEVGSVDTDSYDAEESASAILTKLKALDRTVEYTIGAVRGKKLNSLNSQIGQIFVVLHHYVPQSDTTEETDVSVELTVTSIESDNILGIEYIGTDADFIDEAHKVQAKYAANYGSGSEYAILDKNGNEIVVDAFGTVIGRTSSSGVITPASGYFIYYSSLESAQETLDALLSYSLESSVSSTGSGDRQWYIVNGNNASVDGKGTVVAASAVPYYSSEDSAQTALNRIKTATTKAYYISVDKATGKHILRNTQGKLVRSTGQVVNTFYKNKSEADSFVDSLNGIVFSNNLYYIQRRIDNTLKFWSNDNEWTDVFDNRKTFTNLDDPTTGVRAFVFNNNLDLYHVSNTFYVIAEIAAGWDIMMNEIINGVLMEKKLTVHYTPEEGSSDPVTGWLSITPDMMDYDKMDSSTGYRKVMISYKNYTCDAYIYVWRAELTGVEISKMPLKNYIRNSDLDVSDGVLKLTFTKYDSNNREAGFMYKYISMEDPDITYSGFRTDRYSKDGLSVTISVQYKDYKLLRTSYDIKVYDLQDVIFTFNNTIFFYGNVSAAGYTTTQVIPEFTLPKASYEGGTDILMYYIETKDLIPYKQFEAMNLSEDAKASYLPVTVYDETKEYATIFYIDTNKKKSSETGIDNVEKPPFFAPASGSFYVVRSAYVRKDENGVIVDRYTEAEYKALSPEEKNGCATVSGSGDILYMYTQEAYDDLQSADVRALCTVEKNQYYLLMTVKGNKYYETRNYCLQDYAIMQSNIEVKVATPDRNAYVLRVTTSDNADGVEYFLSNKSNLKNLMEEMQNGDVNGNNRIENFSTVVNTDNFTLASPNKDYFEFLIGTRVTVTPANRPTVEAVITECFYRLLVALRSKVSDIQLIPADGSPSDEYFTNASNRKDEMKTFISNNMRQGVNWFTELRSDTDYDITYVVDRGSLKIYQGKQELLSGKIHLKNNGGGTFTTVTGSLGHPSYSIDLTAKDISPTTTKRNLQVSLIANSAEDMVLRLYMKNASEVYSKWYLSGEFATIKAEIMNRIGPDAVDGFISDIAVVSPNKEYFELIIAPGSSWTGSDDQKESLRENVFRLTEHMLSFGATEVLFGGDVHLFKEGAASKNDVMFFSDGTATNRKVYFTANLTETDITSFYSSFASDVNVVDASYLSNLYVVDGLTQFTLQTIVTENWQGNETELTNLANAVLDFVDAMKASTGGKVYYNGLELDDVGAYLIIRNAIEERGINKISSDSEDICFRLPIEFTGDVWTFIRDSYDTVKGDILTDFSPYINDVSLFTAETFSSVTFSWRSTGDGNKIDEIFYNFLTRCGERATHIYYGSGVYLYKKLTFTPAQTIDEREAMEAQRQENVLIAFATAIKEGVNVFDYNGKKLYEVSYTVAEDALLHYSEVYVLLSGELDVDEQGGTTGEFGVTKNTLGNELYNVALAANGAKVSIR